MSRFTTLLMSLSLLAVLVPASAQAAFIPTYEFHGEMPAMRIGEEDTEEGFQIGVVTGKTEIRGESGGLWGFFSVDRVVATNIRRLEVYDPSGNLSRLPRNELGLPTQPQIDVFHNATLTIEAGASFLYYAPKSVHTFALDSDFALALPVEPPARMVDSRFDAQVNTSLLTIGAGLVQADWTNTTEETQMIQIGEAIEVWVNSLREPVLYPLSDEFNVTIVAQNRSEPAAFSGRNNAFRVLGSIHLEVEGRNTLSPIAANVTATFRPGPKEALEGAFDLTALAEQVGDLQKGNESDAPSPSIDAKTQEIFDALGPLLNGAMVGNVDPALTINGHDVTRGAFTLIRYDELSFSQSETDGSLAYEGRGRFFLAGNQLYTEKTATGHRFFPIPFLSIFLWVVAGVAIVLGLTLKPFLPNGPGFAAGMPLRILGIAVHILLFIIAFILWDLEIKAYLGTSLLQGGGSGLSLPAVLGIELAGFSFAALFFGLPVRFVINTGLKMIGLKKARGLGKGLGNLSTWALGAAFIPVFLNPAITFLFERLSQGL